MVYNKILRTHSVDNISSFVITLIYKNRKITVKFIKKKLEVVSCCTD